MLERPLRRRTAQASKTVSHEAGPVGVETTLHPQPLLVRASGSSASEGAPASVMRGGSFVVPPEVCGEPASPVLLVPPLPASVGVAPPVCEVPPEFGVPEVPALPPGSSEPPRPSSPPARPSLPAPPAPPSVMGMAEKRVTRAKVWGANRPKTGVTGSRDAGTGHASLIDAALSRCTAMPED